MPIEVGSVVEGKVSGITKFGAFIQLPDGTMGLLHISEIADNYVTDVKDYLKENQTVKVKVIGVDMKGKPSLSLKKVAPQQKNRQTSGKPPENIDWAQQKSDNLSFEERLSKFKKDSEEKLSDLKRSFESKRGGGGYKRSIPF